mmetsp:Transcript_21790/g.53800  ORF Transcript_21790/g.53800 Transcript_21790/m.53800 type:complete len:110 (-) Transcript_21790:1415-1744(-)
MAFITSAVPTTKLATTSFVCTRPVVAAAPRRALAPVMSISNEKVEAAIKEAQEVAAKSGKDSKEAAAAWDVVEELEAEASHAASKKSADPLDAFCEEDPAADECRVYED